MNHFKLSALIFCVVGVDFSNQKTYSALNSIIFSNLPEPDDDVHSEYFFGKCLTSKKDLIVEDHLEYKDIKGQIIVRGYMDINSTSVPNCVQIEARSPHGDMVRYNAYKFTVCLLYIVHNSKGQVHTYYYYEWFIPVEMQEGISWNLYFYLAE